MHSALRKPVLALAAFPLACGPPGDEALPEAVTDPAATYAERHSADPTARGYTEADFPRVQELASGVYSYEALRSAGEERFTTVSFFVVTDEGVLVADGQGSVDETARLVDRIAEVTDKPITHVVVCSDHGDHTAGNAAFPEGVEFIAHSYSAGMLERRANDPLRPDETPPIPLATRLVEEATTLTLGGRTIEILHLGRAHTGGDLVVHLPVERILFMSEAYLHGVFPAMRSAYPSEWVAMIERAQALGAEMIVPGHGFVDDAAILAEGLEQFRGAVAQVIAEVSRLYHDGFSLENAQATVDFGDLAEWSLYDSQADRAVAQVYRELDGELGSD